MNTKRVGLFGLMAFALAGLFHPAVASAQQRCDYHRYYAPVPVVIRHDHYVARERVIIQRREWRERHFDGRCYR